eukprot:5950299-Prymnesium_polylepis.1
MHSFSVERLDGALDEFDMEELNEAASGEHGHGHDEQVSEHGHAESDHAEADHGHAEDSMDCDKCDEPAPVGGAHEHDHALAEKRKKKHDLSGVGSLGL